MGEGKEQLHLSSQGRTLPVPANVTRSQSSPAPLFHTGTSHRRLGATEAGPEGSSPPIIFPQQLAFADILPLDMDVPCPTYHR